MPVLTRSALEASPLADLHELASELGIDGYRKLRRDDLVGTLLERGDGADDDGGGRADEAPTTDRTDDEGGRSRGGRSRGGRDGGDDEPRGRGGRSRRGGRDDQGESGNGGSRGGGGGGRGRGRGREPEPQVDTADEEGPRGPRRGRTRGGSDTDEAEQDTAPRGRSRRDEEDRDAAPARGRGRGRDRDDARDDRDADEGPDATAGQVEGSLSLAGSGSGFVRVSDEGPSDGDVYVSAAQIKRCELVEGDRVGGPVRTARRSERHPSLVRVETINGRPADEEAVVATPVQRQAAVWPHERLALGSDDPTVKAIEWLVPIGRGSRVTITGTARAGKTEALRRLATAIAAVEGVELIVALAGVRPEEIGDWTDLGVAPGAATDLGAPHDKQLRVIEDAIERGRRIAARGGHAVVAIDSLDDVDETAARRVLASARRLQGDGSLTVIATSTEPVGGESTVVALDVALTSTGRFPALDLAASGTLRPELLVGEAGAAAIAAARAETLG